MGIDFGNISAVSTEIEEDTSKLKNLRYELTMSYTSGALFGAFVTIIFRRKWSLAVGNTAVIMGSVVIMFQNAGSQTLLVNRFLIGLGVSVFTVVCPMMISDISSIKWRAAFIAVWGVILNFGLFLSAAASDIFLALVDWKWLLAFPIFPSAFEMLFVIGTSKDALDGFGNDKSNQSKMTLFKPLAAASLVLLSSNMIGYKHVLFIAPKHVSFFVLAAVALVGTILSIPVTHRFPRIAMLSISMPVLVIILITLIFIDPSSSGIQYLIMVYVFIYSLCLATLPIVYTIEIFPVESKGLGCSLIGVLNWILSFTINFVVKHCNLNENEQLGSFSVISAIIWLIMIICLPETKTETISEKKTEVKRKENLGSQETGADRS